MGAVDAFFTADVDSYMPGNLTRGPWGNTMGGQIVGGLLGWALDGFCESEFQPARLTVDLLCPVMLEPVQIETSVKREGRRLRLVDGALLQSGRVVARASALFLRRSEDPDGEVWSSPVSMPPIPTSQDKLEIGQPFEIWTYGVNADSGSENRSGRVGAGHHTKICMGAIDPPHGGRASAHAFHPRRLRRRHC